MHTLADIHTLLQTLAHTRPHCAPLRIPTHTLAYPRTPIVVVELIVVVVDEFELINHM